MKLNRLFWLCIQLITLLLISITLMFLFAEPYMLAFWVTIVIIYAVQVQNVPSSRQNFAWRALFFGVITSIFVFSVIFFARLLVTDSVNYSSEGGLDPSTLCVNFAIWILVQLMSIYLVVYFGKLTLLNLYPALEMETPPFLKKK